MKLSKKVALICTTLLAVGATFTTAYVLKGGNSKPKEELYSLEIQTVYAMAETAGYKGTLDELVAMFKGEAGADGVGVESAVIENNRLILTLTNGNKIDCGEFSAKDGKDGQTPTIGENGNWFIGEIDTGKSAFGVQGEQGVQGAKGDQGEKGDKGDQGVQGIQGEKGEKGDQGIQGEQGDQGERGVGIESIKKTATNGLVDTYTITYSDSNKASVTFTVTNARSIEKTEIDGNGYLIIYYNDDTQENLGKVVGGQGVQGEKGEKGDQGIQGIQGEQGEQGIQGEAGKTVEFRVDGEWLQWKYVTESESEWKNLYETDGTPAPEGLVKLTYVLYGGVMPEGTPSEVDITAGTSIVLPTPSYHGYTFAGWYENLNDKYPVSESYRVHESTKLYAKWEAGAIITGKKIYNLNDFVAISNNLSGTYVLMNDIDCGGIGLPAIGKDSNTPFTGIFEGQGYTISNYTISVGEYMGLFGYSFGTIRNLNVEDFKIEQKTNVTYSTLNAGGLVAYNAGTVKQCSAQNGTINLQLNSTRRGGLLVAENVGIITNCFATGTVTINQNAKNSNWAQAGGLVGANRKEISNCYANAQLNSNGTTSSYAEKGEAALIASVNEGTIKNCFVLGYAKGSYRTGDISGRSDGTIDNCYKDENLTLVDMTHTYATAQSKAIMSSVSFYTISLGWDSKVWNFTNLNLDNGIYPTLKYNA